MKYRWEKKYLYMGVTAFLVIAAGLIFNTALNNSSQIFGFLNSVLSLLTPVLYGFVMAYLLLPVATFFEKKVLLKIFTRIYEKRDKRRIEKGLSVKNTIYTVKKLSRGFGVTCTMLAAIILVTGLVWAVLPQLLVTIQNLVNNMPSYIKGFTKWSNDTLSGYPEISHYVADGISEASNAIQDWLKNDLLPQLTNVVAVLSEGIIGVITTFLNIILGFVVCIYFLYSKELFCAQGKKLLFSTMKPKYANMTLRNVRHIHKRFGGFITGKLLDSLLIGMIYFIILTIFDFPFPMLTAVIMGLMNIIPYFGPYIGAVPTCLLVLMEDPNYILPYIIMVCVIQQFDGSVLAPKILGDSTGLSSFWVIFALLLGQGIFGFVGLIIGIPLFAVIYSIVRARVGDKLEERGLSSDSNDYRDVMYLDEETNGFIKFPKDDDSNKAEKKKGFFNRRKDTDEDGEKQKEEPDKEYMDIDEPESVALEMLDSVVDSLSGDSKETKPKEKQTEEKK